MSELAQGVKLSNTVIEYDSPFRSLHPHSLMGRSDLPTKRLETRPFSRMPHLCQSAAEDSARKCQGGAEDSSALRFGEDISGRDGAVEESEVAYC